MQHFNPIQSNSVVATPIRRVRLLQQSIPFGVAILYIMVQNFKFSLALKAKGNHHLCKQFYFNMKHKPSISLSCFTIKYIFPCERIRFLILLAIFTHINCANSSKCSVRYIFKANKQGSLKVSLSIFYYCSMISFLQRSQNFLDSCATFPKDYLFTCIIHSL